MSSSRKMPNISPGIPSNSDKTWKQQLRITHWTNWQKSKTLRSMFESGFDICPKMTTIENAKLF